jgi:hypothetical protein
MVQGYDPHRLLSRQRTVFTGQRGTYADSTTVHHCLIFRLNGTRVMEDHDHTFESLDRYSSAKLLTPRGRRTFGWGLGLGDQHHPFSDLCPLYTFQSESIYVSWFTFESSSAYVTL